MNLLNKYWNYKISGICFSTILILRLIIKKKIEFIFSFFYKKALNSCGKNVVIQQGVIIRYPKNILLKDNINIGRNVEFGAHNNNGSLTIDSQSQVNSNCIIDFTGNIKIGRNVVISASTIIETHSHGYNPKSKPIASNLIIQDNVWIGRNCLILPQVNKIGKNSIVAAGSVLTKDVEPFCIVGGNPAKIIKKLK